MKSECVQCKKSMCHDCDNVCTTCKEAECDDCFDGMVVDPDIFQCNKCKIQETEVWRTVMQNKIPGVVVQLVVKFLNNIE